MQQGTLLMQLEAPEREMHTPGFFLLVCAKREVCATREVGGDKTSQREMRIDITVRCELSPSLFLLNSLSLCEKRCQRNMRNDIRREREREVLILGLPCESVSGVLI